MKATVTKIVTCCYNCPFLDSGYGLGRCDYCGLGNGSEIGFNTLYRMPGWCPLRTTDVLYTTNKKSTKPRTPTTPDRI